MTFIIRDADTLKAAKVDTAGRLETHATTRTQADAQSELGQAFVLNTKDVNITTDSALLYIKNNNATLVMHATFLAMGVGVPSVGFDGVMTVEVLRNPTGGTILNTPTTTAIKANQNFGNSNVFDDIDSFVGADGETVTGGTDLSHFTQVASTIGGRLSAGLTWVMPPGATVGIKVLPNLTSGNIDVNLTIVGYFDEPGS